MLLAPVLAGLGCGVADGESALGGDPVEQVARALTTVTASMGTARYDHAALRLLDGRVLVVGGMSVQNGGVPLASAEIFDPAAGTWRATGSMAVGRHAPEAVRLADGRVLVMGGVGPAVGWTGESPVLKSAEIFEPSTGTWSKVADMSVPRFGHSALRLRDGRVLVVGSGSGSAGQVSPELFDPATGSWSLTGRNATGRMKAGLIELDDGRVLVVGGTVVSSSCEVWSPVHGTWTRVGSTIAGRNRNSMVLARLAGGRVLVAGNNFGDRSAEIFDPVAGLWRGTGALNERHYDGVGVQLDTGAVVFGGESVWGGPTARLERYDVASETWSVVGALGSARSAPVGVPLADGGALFIGGHVYSNGASGTPVGVATVDRLMPLSDSPGGAIGSCALSVATVEAAPRGAITTIRVTLSAGGPWAVTGLPAWANALPASGVGSGSFTLAVAPNTGLARSATLRVCDTSLALAQASALMTAALSAAHRVPACSAVGVSCDTDTLVAGRAAIGPERNAPNTIASSCSDGAYGRYHVDESIDRIKVSTADGGWLGVGKTVHVDVSVWAWTDFTTDALDIFTTTSPTGFPSWTLRATLKPTKAGPQTLRYSFVLPAAATQAVRAQFRFRGSASTACTSGPFDDRDDLVFAVSDAALP